MTKSVREALCRKERRSLTKIEIVASARPKFAPGPTGRVLVSTQPLVGEYQKESGRKEAEEGFGCKVPV